MKYKSKRLLDRNNSSAEAIKLSTNHDNHRKIFYNPIFAETTGSTATTSASCVRKKSKKADDDDDENGCEKSRDKRTRTRNCDSELLRNNREDVTEIGSSSSSSADVVEAIIMNGDHHQIVQDYKKVSSSDGGVGFNNNNAVKRSAGFVASRENNNSNVVLKNSRVVASYLEEIPSSGVRDPMVNMKIEEEKMSDRKNAAVSTDPECLGPCDPGSSVVLEGIVWNESRNGLLVVNVTWRGKTYVGTLMDSSNHHWGSPCFRDGSWGLEMKEEDVEGRRLRRTRTHTSKIHKLSSLSSSSSSSTTTTAAVASASSATHNNGSSCPDDASSSVQQQNLKEFACPVVSCSKRFKSLSGLKTHKCVASSSQKESYANLKHSDVLATGSMSSLQSNPDKSLTCTASATTTTATGHKVAKATGSGRCRQAALKRRNHFTDEHLNGKAKVESFTSDVSAGRSESPRCKIKFSEAFTTAKTPDSQPAKPSSHRSSNNNNNNSTTNNKGHTAAATVVAGKSEKLRKNGKPTDAGGSINGKRKLKQSRISRASNNSSDAFNASTNAFPSNSESKISHKIVQGNNGAIKNPLLKTSDSKGTPPPPSNVTTTTKDTNSLSSCSMDTCRKPESSSLPVKCTTFCDKTAHQSYAGVSSQKYGAKVCSSQSHSTISCSKCSSPSVETQLPPFKSSIEASKSLVSRPSLIALATGCNKAHLVGQSAVTNFPSSAPVVVASSAAAAAAAKQEDMFCGEVPLEANTASEVFSHDTRHFKQAAANTSAAEGFLYAKQ